MSKPILGVVVGAVLGLLDGLSAWAHPEARTMLATIVIGSTIKGLITGGVTGLVARRWHSIMLGVVVGLVCGLVLSSLAALGQSAHYFEIVLPGMVLGAIVGFVTQRYPREPASSHISRSVGAIVLAASLIPAGALGQNRAMLSVDPLAALAFSIGSWEGSTEGQPGKGTVQREYSRVLGSRFIQVQNRSSYLPQEKNPKGEEHEDIGMFGFDSARKRIVFRQFHIEGFVTQYVVEQSESAWKLVFTSEAIENIATGWRARETYLIAGPDQFEEVFELAPPGKDFELYSRTRLSRRQ